MTLSLEPTILVIFGSMGDLTWRKLAPALYNLLLGEQLPEKFAVVGLDIKGASGKLESVEIATLTGCLSRKPWRNYGNGR